jgi:hypothetical protein
MEIENAGYRQILTEIIRKQIEILGPALAISKARKVSGLKINDEGEVTQITGSDQDVLQGLIAEYVALSGEVVTNLINSVFSKYN